MKLKDFVNTFATTLTLIMAINLTDWKWTKYRFLSIRTL